MINSSSYTLKAGPSPRMILQNAHCGCVFHDSGTALFSWALMMKEVIARAAAGVVGGAHACDDDEAGQTPIAGGIAP